MRIPRPEIRKDRPTALRAAPVLLAILLASSLGGCAIMNRDNTPLLNMVEENLWPESMGAQVAVFPLVFPTGIAAVVVDAVLIHPILVIDDALSDTSDILWEEWDFDEHYMTHCMTIPWRAVLSPLIFSFDFLGRSLFDIPNRADVERQRAARDAEMLARAEEEARQVNRYTSWQESVTVLLDEAEELMDKGLPAEALDKIAAADFLHGKEDRTLRIGRRSPLLSRIRFLLLKAAWESGRIELIDPAWAAVLWKGKNDAETESILGAMRWSDDAATRWTAFRFDMARRRSFHGKPELFRNALKDASLLLRHSALESIARHIDDETRSLHGEFDELLPDLERIAAHDADPIIRNFAKQLVGKIKSGRGR
jgi:hypothetical protein